MAGFPREFLEELKYKCDIVTIVSQYVPLVKKGGKYFCCCPFHNEKTPSMCVNTDGQYYHCFGCGASGDVITFVMEMESVDYPEAVSILADKAGLTLPEYRSDPEAGRKKDKKETLKRLMRDVALYYHSNLVKRPEGEEARKYLEGRGIPPEMWVRFGLGLSLGYDQMTGYMRRKGYTVENLRDCGLAVGESVSDAFHGRIIVPIMNGMGEVIAFGGRIYRGEQDVAKYKNSTNTLLFDKSRCVYGVNFVKREKKRVGGFENLILVEGYMDVIALASAGFMNAVAGMGTALTPQQAREIRKLTDKVLVCYDGDKAGRSAAVRNVQPLAAEGIEVRVVSLPDGMDPDDAVKALGADGVKKLLDAALPLVEYKLKLAEDAYGLATANGRAKYVTAALRVLSEVENAAEREVYMGVVSAKSGVSVETLAAESAGKSRTATPAKREREPREGEGREVRAARFVLNSLLQNRPYANASAVSEDWFASEEHRRILRFVKSQPAGKVVAGNLFGEDAPSEEVGNILAEDPALKSAEKEAGYYADCVTVLANAYLSEQIKKLTEEYKDLADRDEKAAALTRLKTLQKKLKSKNATDKF